MLGSLGYHFTMAPYTAQSFWVNLRNSITNCDYIYLQCYEGGADNDLGQWNTAFGNGVVVIPGQESNTANEAMNHNWYLETGVQGGFYYPDVVFNSTYWSAAIIEGYGAVPPAPAGLAATAGGKQVAVSWNTAPGAMSYTVKRSTSGGGETAIGSVSATTNVWPVSNEYTDAGLTSGMTYYYKIAAVNSNGASPDSVEVSATPQAGLINNASFEADVTPSGTSLNAVPVGWTAFNEGRSDYIGSQNAGGADYTAYNPLAAPADGSQFCWINAFSTGVPEGIYQDVGALQANTQYTLTVAIGSRNDRIDSPGIISLVNGANHTGTVIASGGGLPAATNRWQDYTVSFITGPAVSGDLTIMLSALGAGTIQADFDNVRLTTAPVPVTATPTAVPITNFSFEVDAATAVGGAVTTVPGKWTAFNRAGGADIGSQSAGGVDYGVYNPLAAPAAGKQFCYVNMFNSSVTGGIYQDVGPLEASTVYTLIVAIGSRKDRINSPGIISLVNGANNTGTPLASGGGVPPAQDAWQDYMATYRTGASVSGDLTIALSVLGNGTTIQADFDNVRLTKARIVLIAPALGTPKVLGGNLILTGAGGTGNSGYTWLATTNLSPPIHWTTNRTGTLDSSGAFSNAIPINASRPANFLRLRMP
jgi:hypothetical protein